MQRFITSISELELNKFMSKVDQNISELQSKATIEDIQLAVEETRTVVFQKIHDSIALCSKKDACAEDRAQF